MPPLNSGGDDSEFTRILKERVDRLREGVETLTREFLEPLPVSASDAAVARDPARRWGRVDPDFLSESVRSLASSEDQISLLDRLLEGAARCFSRVCLFIVQEDGAHGWSSVGLPETEQGDPAKGLVISLQEDSILRAAWESREPVRRDVSGDEILYLPPHRPGDRLPATALAVPLLVLEKVAAVLYADDGGDGPVAHESGCVEVLSSVASLTASRLALLSQPEGADLEARAEVELQLPPPDARGPESEPPHPLEADPLEDELGFSQVGDAVPSGPEPENLAPDEKTLHEDARRFARLLISELLLYNEDLVILGRKQRDVYSKLKNEIDRSRQAYDQRVPRQVSAKVDYFREELIRTLAGGDPTALGPGLAP